MELTLEERIEEPPSLEDEEMGDAISLGATEEEDLIEWLDSYVSVVPLHHSKLYADFPLSSAGEGASSSCRVNSTHVSVATPYA